jgi:glycosyltransferase involved in cell wall biosynthesis
MTIAINAGFTDIDLRDNNTLFLFECFSKLAQQHPQHQFIYLCSGVFNEIYITSKNTKAISIGSFTKNSLLLQYRLNYKLPALLRKQKVDVFISTNYCSLRTKVPQCLIINNLSFLHHPQLFTPSWLRFYKSNTPKFLAKATTVVTHLQFLKNEINTQYKIAPDKISVSYYGINKKITPISWEQKNAVKEEFTNGVEYFLYAGPIAPQQNLITLLKAFSFFKKRQKSNMQLVIASTNMATDEAFIKSLALYKYKEAVKFLPNLPTDAMAPIMASAYAFVYPSATEIFEPTVTQAMQSGVPVIANPSKTITEVCGNAALYCNPTDFNDIADKMMMLFKDENKRNELIVKGQQQTSIYNCNKTTDALWQTIVNT